MKILLSAYACAPDAGSEPGVGFRALTAAARQHEVWLLTRVNNLPALEQYIASHGLGDRVHLEGLDVPGRLMARKGRGLSSLHRYYDLWQRAAGSRGQELHRQVGFDVVHHATFASYWTRPGVASVPVPLVWGPVGGGVQAPVGLLGTLGVPGVLEEFARTVGREVAAARFRAKRTARGAVVAFAQNRDTAKRLQGPGFSVGVMPVGTAVVVPTISSPGQRTSEVAFVGRLIPWKAGVLAVRAFRYIQHPDAVLVVFGVGPDEGRMRRAARRWSLEDRVQFVGRLPRPELLHRAARCGALLHPALHDESPLTVAEALSLGTPVVCLNRGGPPTLAAFWPSSPATVVPATTPAATARRLAAAIDHHLNHPPPILTAPRGSILDFEEELLSAYRQAGERSGGVKRNEGHRPPPTRSEK